MGSGSDQRYNMSTIVENADKIGMSLYEMKNIRKY